MEYQAATQRDEPVTIRMRRCRPRGATSARHITLAQKTRQSITRKCNAFGANKGFERHGADAAVATIRIGERGTLSFAVDPFTDSGHATGRSRTDPYRLSPLGWPGHHRVPESVFHDVPTAAASSTGSEAGVARHRNTVEHSVCLRCDRA